jgi:hypothetical protein
MKACDAGRAVALRGGARHHEVHDPTKCAEQQYEGCRRLDEKPGNIFFASET